MAKTSVFKILTRKYPQFNNLSTNYFSQLHRLNEIYPIIRQLREDYPAAKVEFFSYPIISTKELGRKLFSFIQNNINN